ncbi:MAG: flagellar biosynthesis protein FlhF [Pseudomonadales bacterium]|nr:flagellar biosynthesis protein FlhF [Pseudomonadales bacterium]
MAVKRFYAADMHTALYKIRNQLGADAVILATRQLADGVEVSAVAGLTDSVINSNLLKSESNDSGSSLQKDNWALNSISGFEEEQSVLHSELGSICSLLQNWMDSQGWDSFATKSPMHAKLWERYRAIGIEPEHINSLLSVISSEHDVKKAWQLSLAQLSRTIPVASEELIQTGGVFAFLGATGVGKTTTIGKLATRYVLQHGADSVALVTTDRYRIAAHEQLRTLGKILGLSVHAVDDENDLESVLHSLRGKQLVLIDTAGINSTHKNFNQQFELIRTTQTQIKPFLVLAATSQIQVQRAELSAYSALKPVAAIVTKTDEAASLGESLSLLISSGLPIAYQANGQSIPEDISVANTHQLINDAVTISRQKPVNKEQMIAGFSAVLANTGSREAHAASVN